MTLRNLTQSAMPSPRLPCERNGERKRCGGKGNGFESSHGRERHLCSSARETLGAVQMRPIASSSQSLIENARCPDACAEGAMHSAPTV